MENILTSRENNTEIYTKKNWLKPSLELISRDIVKSGAVPSGTEGVPTIASAQQYGS